MVKSPAFQFYPDAWLGSPSILCMTPSEEGAYIHLLCIAWNTDDCSLPDDDNQLAILSRLGEGWSNGSSTKIRKCFVKKDGKLYNERLLKEREKQVLWREKSSKAGKKGAKKRWPKRINDKQDQQVGVKMVNTKSTPTEHFQSQSISQSISQDSISNLIESSTKIEQAQVQYGNKEINEMLLALKNKIGISAFVDRNIERQIGKHCVNLLGQLGKEEFVRRLDILLKDPFHHKNCNKIKYVYNQLKGWIEIESKQNKIVFTS